MPKGINMIHVAKSLYFIINFLFIIKYVDRLNSLFIIPLLIIYTVFIFLLFRIKEKEKYDSLIKSKWLLTILLSFAFLLIVLQCMIDPYLLNVDRWSAIDHFLHNLFNGNYPYAAKTHLGGYASPFPIWQFLHIPFFLVKNVGLSCILGIILLFHSIYKLFGYKSSVIALIFLLSSPAFVYEVIVRSDLMTNFLLVGAVVCYLHYYHITFNSHWLVISLICGLLMSTRLSAIIPLIVYYLNDYLHTKCSVKILFILLTFSIFIITFLPFLLWNSEKLLFFEYNPFILQSRQGHISDFFLFIPLGIWLSISWKGDIQKYFFNTALLLFCLVVITFIHNMFLYDNWNELFSSAYDITYFNMSLTFLIYFIALSKK